MMVGGKAFLSAVCLAETTVVLKEQTTADSLACCLVAHSVNQSVVWLAVWTVVLSGALMAEWSAATMAEVKEHDLAVYWAGPLAGYWAYLLGMSVDEYWVERKVCLLAVGWVAWMDATMAAKSDNLRVAQKDGRWVE